MEEDTIKIKKGAIWKVATVILAVALVVVLIVALGGNGKATGNSVQANQQQGVNLHVFVENPVTGEKTKCNEAILTFVAIDQNGAPLPVLRQFPRQDAGAAGRRGDHDA